MSLHVKNKHSQNGTNKNSSQVSQMKQNTTFGAEQNNTQNGTAEINYNQSANSQVVGSSSVGGANQQVTGPQLTFDKTYLCMRAKLGDVQQDKVVVTNVGTTTVTYDWHKVNRPDYIQSKNSDGIQRFFCHYPRGILKPGESKTFIFSFRSQSTPGMYFEEWQLLTEPSLLTNLPQLNISGVVISRDDKIQFRQNYRDVRETTVKNKLIQEILEQDLLDKVESSPSLPPNLRDPEVFKTLFEQNNRHLGLYYTPQIMNKLFELLEDIQYRINDGNDYISPWSGKIEYLEDLITSNVPNKYSRVTLKERYVLLQAQARKVPINRAQSYQVFRKMLLDLSESTIELETKGREELQMIESFGFTVPHENQTEEEVKKLLEEAKVRKADWLKKTKRKPKTEEEENLEMEELKSKISQGLKHEIHNTRIQKAEQEIEYVKTKWLFDNHTKMDVDQYDELHRLESILDIDISGKDLVMRLDLDVPLTPYVPPQPLSQQQTMEEHKSQANTKLKKTQQQQQQEALLLQQLQAQQQEDPWKKRQILDHTLIKKATNGIRYAIEHLANRTFIIGNLGEKHGKIKPENSMKIVYNVLQQQLIEQQMIFLPDANIKDFERRKENEEFPESSTFMLENLNFKPDEFGYVEPDKPPEEPKPSEEEVKREEELKQQQLAAQQKGGAAGKAAPPKPADKKKAEEEAKKKAEEEAAAAALKKKQESEKMVSEEERQEQQRLKEEAERRKRELEYFDYRTIHQYKELLGRYGDIYVNDAPLMSLTNSNSIAEIKSKRRVMGVRMTEEIRKLTIFFMKKNPTAINNRWYTKPTVMPYHEKNLTVYVGGCIKNGSELLEKVLMINSLMDTAQNIHLYGEVGLAALYCLDITVPRVERSADAHKDYEKCKDFFLSMFKRSIVEAKVTFFFPIDFQVSQKIEIEDSVDVQNITSDQHNQSQGSINLTQQQQQKTQFDKTVQSKQQQNNSLLDDVTKGSQGQIPPHLQEPPKWKPYHWADKIIDKQKHRYVNIEKLIAYKWNNMVGDEFKKWVEETSFYTYDGYYTHTNVAPWSVVCRTLSTPEDLDVGEPIQEDEYALEYGDFTRQKIFSEMELSFKLLWDGSISFFRDAVLASETNKQFVSKLLDFRTRTQNDDEPPVTLLHGSETEVVIRHSLMRIKQEQQEALEAAKRKAALEGEEVEEEEDQITMTNEESREEAQTLQQDMSQIADFLCFEVPQFTTKVIQGVPIKALYNLDQHPKRTKEQEEEDLSLLEEI